MSAGLNKAIDAIQKLIGPILILILSQLFMLKSDISAQQARLEEIKTHFDDYKKIKEMVPTMDFKLSETLVRINQIANEQEKRTDTYRYMDALKNAGGWPLTIESRSKK